MKKKIKGKKIRVLGIVVVFNRRVALRRISEEVV